MTTTITLRELRDELKALPIEELATPGNWMSNNRAGTTCYCPILTIAYRLGLVSTEEIFQFADPSASDPDKVVIARMQRALGLDESTVVDLIIEHYDDIPKEMFFGAPWPDPRYVGLQQTIRYIDALLDGVEALTPVPA